MMPVASQHVGMGANLLPGGCAFRVWAPHAEAVAVTGSFNGWSHDAHPLVHESHGYWSADVPGAKYRDEYKYVIVHQGRRFWRNDPYAREMTRSNGNSVIIDPSFKWGDENGYRMPSWNELVIYEMHVGTFNDMPGGGPGGFDGVIAKLDYLSDELCVNAIQIMPAFEFPLGFSWGYNPAHIFAIERDYGGPKALRRLIKAAHEHGIAVVFDVVYNHFGPGDLDLWQFDGWKDPDHEGGIYFYDNRRRQTPWGPRPDYGRGEVRQYIRDNVLFWLGEFRIDGLRFDATAYIRSVGGDASPLPDGWGLLQWINDEVDSRMSWKITIAEDLRKNEWITKDTAAGGAGFDSQWDAGFVHPVRAALTSPHDENRDMHAVRNAILHTYNGSPLKRVVYTESHDEVANGKRRVPEEIWPGNASSWYSKKRSTLGAAVVMTSPGIPMIFQGQEFLEDRWFHDQDPIEWWRKDHFAGLVRLYRDLIRLRRNWFNNTRGLRGAHAQVFHVNDWDKVIAYRRWEHGGPGDEVVVAANFSGRTFPSYKIGLPREGIWWLRFNSDARGYDADFGTIDTSHTFAQHGPADELPYSGEVALPPYTALMFSQ